MRVRVLRRSLAQAVTIISLVAALASPAAAASDVVDGVGLTDPTLSLNLQGVSYWSSEQPFLDLMHTAETWFGASNATFTFQSLDSSAIASGGYLDANGWPTSIPTDNATDAIRTTWVGDSFERNEDYVVTWDGTGTVAVRNWGGAVTIVSSEPGRIVFSASQDVTGIGLDIMSTDPGQTGDYVRDISVVPEKYEALAQTGELFNPDWLSLVEDSRQLRFMDWMQTNGSPQVDWSDRPQVDDYSWLVKGVPVEVMVQLCNQIGADPWFNMPAMANDDYVTQFASYVRDHLDPDLKASVEWSNEVWNWGFSQTTWAQQQAQALWGTDPFQGIPPTDLDYQAMRATQVGAIWDQVFGDDAKARVDNVLGLQNGNAGWLGDRILTASLWASKGDPNFIDPTSVIDSVAVTTYFGWATLAETSQRDQLLNAIKTMSFDDAATWLAGQLLDPANDESVPKIADKWAAVKAVTQAYGLNLVAYEGGQHVLQGGWDTTGLSADDINAINTFLAQFSHSQQITGVYQALWDAWAEAGNGPFMQYYDVGQTGQYGAWGLYTDLADTNPLASLLTGLNDQQDAWFGDGGGSRYQQGVILFADNSGQTLTGTDKQDFLIGGDGNDTLISGDGPDALNGGMGDDIAILPGPATNYAISRPEADGPYRIEGPDGTKTLFGIEKVAFDGGRSPAVALRSLHR